MSIGFIELLYLTDKISQHQIVTVALFLVGGENRFVDTEDVAVKAHELAPERFCWRKYPQFPNLELVRVFLSDAKKPDKGALVSGSGRKGWTLTPEGLRWVKKRQKALGQLALSSGDQIKRSRAGSVDSHRKTRELSRIRASNAWEKWNSDASTLTRNDAHEIFRIDSYSDEEMLKLKVERLQKLLIDESGPSDFLKALRKLL